MVRGFVCPKCGKALTADAGLTTCYCMYCGEKIDFTDKNNEVTITKNYNVTYTERDEAEITKLLAKVEL